ncbi:MULTISPECIES: hypothetical protein [unclassified Streptomyces]|uniref:hypothetical protein n=1 Tax=unclassified Streptomyces TaxID=2593676 RepID=UPI0035DC793B
MRTTEGEQVPAKEKASGEARFRKRDVSGLLLYLAVGGPALFFAIGGTRWFSRHVAPTLYDMPGGPWAVGGVLGLLSLVGWAGVLRGRFDGFGGAARTSGLPRAVDIVVRVAGGVAAIAPMVFLISGLPGKNCRSYEPGCAYIPGAGPAALAYVAVAGGMGWLYYRWRRAVTEERRARERERLRKLRKRGKGKSRRAAAGR